MSTYSEAEFCDIFDEIIEEICDNNCILIPGGFNIDWKRLYTRIELRMTTGLNKLLTNAHL